jgi:integrase/recombinase XerD
MTSTGDEESLSFEAKARKKSACRSPLTSARRSPPGCAGADRAVPSGRSFTRVRAPHRGLTPGGVSAIVAAACKRAGVVEVHAHRLRHTAATEMLRAGAGFTEIGQVLRHASVLTTSIYAKVDRSSLQALAKPWPASDTGTVAR